MPKPIFDIQEYELRGVTPPVFSEAQKKRLNQVLSRANGQMDWTAQLLGFNGPNYWGLPNPKADGSYDWKGLPDTMNQKRQLQSTAFGVYNKDREYANRSAPFNRSEILASGDAAFHIWESGGRTYISPAGQGEGIFYSSPSVFVGGEYVFDKQIDFDVVGSLDEILTYSYFSGSDTDYTRVLFKQTSALVQIGIKGSLAQPAFVSPLDWKDISDWKSPAVLNQFIGLWGNKGNNLSFDAEFDALELHGYNEAVSLTLNDTISCFTLSELLAKVGLKATRWTGFNNTELGFQADGCPIAYPLRPADVTDNFTFYTCEGCNSTITLSQTLGETRAYTYNYNNGEYDHNPANFTDELNNGSYDDPLPTSSIDDGIFNKIPPLEPSIKEICFEYKATEEYGLIDQPCLELVIDPELNDGIYPKDEFTVANPGPWMTADDGEYDQVLKCFENAGQSDFQCDDIEFCSFDDGIYNKLTFPECEDVEAEACASINGGFDSFAGVPNYDEDCDCYVDCCLANGSIYINGAQPYVGPNVADDGIYGNPNVTGVYYSDGLYDRDPTDFSCSLDDGVLEGPPSTSTVSEGQYDRIITGLVPCTAPGVPPEVIPCPVSSLRISLNEIYQDFIYKMEPNLANSYTPLRTWKNRVLTNTDEVPANDTEQYNYLIADENRGTVQEDTYRHFVRLPIEYERNGKHWNKAEAVCSNQSYFSTPPNLAQTQNDPPKLRPELYDESYWDVDLKEYATFYEEGYLVSTVRETPQEEVQEGFQNASISSEPPQNSTYSPAAVVDYDALDDRIPQANGDWRGQYLTRGVNESYLTGFVVADLKDQKIELVPIAENPTYDMSRIKRPNVEFPDSVDQAALKNYVVSYAYFITDFSASDDPVFDPNNTICWRQETLTYKKLDSAGVCVPSVLDSRNAYLLHPTT